MAFGGPAARPGEQNLRHEVTSSPRRAGYLTWKSFGGPSEPKAGLGKLGSRKLNKRPFCPSFFGIFHILDQNTE